MRREFWAGKRVLLTGHTGFKGAWLATCLRHLGAEVAGFALQPPTTPSLFELAGVGAGLRDVRGDIRDLDLVSRTVRQAAPEIVIHMAAQSLVRPSYADPVETYSVNVMGTVHLLEAVRRGGGVRAVVVVTSDKCYENREWAWGYRENDPMGGFDPYSNSKGCAELVTAAFRSSYFGEGAAVASARAGNVIGGGDWAAERLVPDAIRAFAARRPVELRNPLAIRPWQHVLEPLRGYLTLAEHLYDGKAGAASPWNFGPSDEDTRPVADVVEKLARLWGEGAAWRLAEGAHPHEARHLKLDCSKARAQLEWRPCLGFDEGLAWTAEWYRAWHGGADMKRATLEQVERYLSLAGTP